MKYFNWEHTVAATLSKIFYKYQRNADERARVPKFPPCNDRSQNIELQVRNRDALKSFQR